jgi:cephalosporin hydroxylase
MTDFNISFRELASLAVANFGAMQKVGEFEQLSKMFLNRGHESHMLEIGVGKGGTSWVWCKLFGYRGKVVAVDMVGGPWGGGPDSSTIDYFMRDSNYSFINADSRQDETFEKVKEHGMFDLLFIDGDHSYEGVKSDYERYSPLVKHGGYIAFHDICEHDASAQCEVKKFWDEIKVGKRSYEFIEEPINWGGIGLLVKGS